MKAVVLTNYGDVDKLEVREVPEPKPGRGEVRLKAAATSINPVDWKLRSGALKGMMPLDLPAILGRDTSGTVAEVGPEAGAFKVGDKVFGLIKQGYAEQVVAKAAELALVPAGLDLRDAAALPLVLTTGAELIEDAVRPQKGWTVLVTGALGGVGRTAVFVAKQHGARVIAGVRAKQKAEAAELGADQVVALDDDAELGKLPPLDAIADTIGGKVTDKLLPLLKKGGTIGSVVGEPPGAKGRDFNVRAFMASPNPKRLAELAAQVASGALKMPIGKRMPLSQAGEAQKLAEKGGVGKVLLTI